MIMCYGKVVTAADLHAVYAGALSRKGVQTARRAADITGICRDAQRLGVTRVHLYLVLKGRRHSARLMNRYAALKGGAA